MKKFILGCMMNLVVLMCLAPSLQGREWSDSTGSLKLVGTLIAFDDRDIIIKLDKQEKGRELIAFPIEKLSAADKEYLRSDELRLQLQESDQRHTWTLKNGLTVIGKVVDFVRKDVTIQRKRNKIFVNDRAIDSFPEVYRKMIPMIVEHFENKTFHNDREFMEWIYTLKGAPKTYLCEGVLLEFPNGDEIAIPFLFFHDSDLRVLKPNWDAWVKATSEEDQKREEQRQYSLYLQSQAAAYQQSLRNQQEIAKVARMQLQLQAVQAGIVDLWEVCLYPGPNSMGYPICVVVAAKNSDIASRLAMEMNPGYTVGPIRKVAGY